MFGLEISKIDIAIEKSDGLIIYGGSWNIKFQENWKKPIFSS